VIKGGNLKVHPAQNINIRTGKILLFKENGKFVALKSGMMKIFKEVTSVVDSLCKV
jgi:uncharacterized protein (DUF342 family)